MSETSVDKCFIESLEEIELSFSFKTYSRTFKATTIRLYTRSDSFSSSFSLHDKIAFPENFLNMEREKMHIAPFGFGPNSLKTELLVELSEEEDEEIKTIVGESKFTFDELLKAAKGSVQLNFSPDCELFVHWTVPESPALDAQITVESLGLRAPTSWFSRQDFRPRFQVYRCISETEETLVYTSEISNTKSFNAWNKFSVKVNHLCKGLKQSPIKIKVFSDNKREKVFGEAMFSLEQVLNSQHIISLADEGKQKRVGSLRVACQLSSSPTFNDYSHAGLSFSTMLSLGFQKNDDHYYNKAIEDILPFLIQASTSADFPIYGTKESSVLKSRRVLSQCRISTVVEKAKYLARFNALYRNQEYVIAVVLTDGDIQDIQEVNRQIKDIENGNLPVSIIFLGIGDDSADFAKLEKSLYISDKTCFIKYESEVDSTLLIREIMKETEEHLKAFIEQEKKGGINQYNLFWQNGQDKVSSDLRAKVPPMVKSWICQNDRKEFAKSKEMIDKFMSNLLYSF